MSYPYKRIFVIVADSAGIGYMPDADRFFNAGHPDKGANTFVHIAEKMPNGLNIPNMNEIGIADLADIRGTHKVSHPHSFVARAREASNGKDTMTGHWEMMGINTQVPFKTFTDTGFPKELIDELERRTGHKVIGNCAASGTEIIKEMGEEQIRDNSLIVYTSSDSVLQIAASEEVTGLQELYRCCEIAREICMKPEWMVGRVIARPYIGKTPETFKRTSNRHDLALRPTLPTVMNILQDNGFMTSCVGKIGDIFDGYGVVKTQKTVSNEDGMDKTINNELLNHDFTGLCFVNLVEFDSEYGHRRNPIGYGEALERFDIRVGEFMSKMNDDDLLIITADHGNDPTWPGTDHTREKIPLLMNSPSIKDGRYLEERECFGDIGATILKNFGLELPKNLIGTPIEEVLNK